MAVKPIPEGYHSITPYLSIKGASKAIEFYKRAFNATELFRIEGPNGSIGHAEMSIGDSRIMLAEETPGMGCSSAETLGGTPVSLMLYVPDVDQVFNRAVAAGAVVQRPVQNQFYGDRSGNLKDPFGNVWNIATHIEDIPMDELKRRADAFMKQFAEQSAQHA